MKNWLKKYWIYLAIILIESLIIIALVIAFNSTVLIPASCNAIGCT